MLEAYAEKVWFLFEVKDVKEATPEEIEWATQLPVIWFGDERKEYDEVLELITK